MTELSGKFTIETIGLLLCGERGSEVTITRAIGVVGWTVAARDFDPDAGVFVSGVDLDPAQALAVELLRRLEDVTRLDTELSDARAAVWACLHEGAQRQDHGALR